MNAIESEVMEKLLAGDVRELQVLRAQLEGLEITGRKSTGTGFVTQFRVHYDAKRLRPAGDFQLGDVQAAMEGLAHGAGFILFVKRGAIDTLEGFTFEEPWPAVPGIQRLYYVHHPRLGDPAFVETPDRDLEQLFPDKKEKT